MRDRFGDRVTIEAMLDTPVGNVVRFDGAPDNLDELDVPTFWEFDMAKFLKHVAKVCKVDIYYRNDIIPTFSGAGLQWHPPVG